MILSLSIVIKGKLEGLEPVAIMMFFASTVSDVPSAFTATCVASTKEPNPSRYSNIIFIHQIFYST
jgi:hypothetical protein